MSNDQTQPDATEQDLNDVLDELGGAEELEALAQQGGGPGPAGLMGMLQGGGISQILLQPTFEDPDTGHQYSQADLIADVVNVMRLDTKQMAALHDVDVEVSKMTAERAAQMLEQMATNSGFGIIEVFQEIEEQRDEIMQTLMSEDQHAQYNDYKRQMLNSIPDDAEVQG